MFQVVDVISGKYDEAIGSVLIVDCRYPYEYDGGHVPVSLTCTYTIVKGKTVFGFFFKLIKSR